MPQQDRYRDRTLELDFNAHEEFNNLPCGRYTLILVSDGSAVGTLNKKAAVITAPCVLCLSDKDSLVIDNSEHIAAQSLSFSADFFGDVSGAENSGILTGLSIFRRDGINTGLFCLEKTVFSKIWEWFFIIGTEVYAQSDSLWVCRIKKYLLQILGMLGDLYREQERDPVNLALNCIYANYYKKITLDELCRRAHTNRVSLNKMFKERCGCTAMGYLNDYRMKVAEKILTYTRMNLSDIAHATGLEYDTYFIRQFTRWKGMSPTQFRKISQKSILDSAEIIL